MTTQELITEMRGKLNDTMWCRSDFENYDAPNVEQCSEPFFWMVRKNGTHFVHIGPSAVRNWLENESARFSLRRDFFAPLASLQNDDGEEYRYYYWDGYTLTETNYNDIKDIYQRIWASAIWNELDNWTEEVKVQDKPIDLCFSEGAEERKQECEKLEKELGTDTFSKCIERLSKWVRRGVDHKINLSVDFCDHSFYFVEYLNGKAFINGGIIFQDGKWSIHT